MLRRLLHFIQYNNAFTILLFIVFVSSSAVFAASPDARATLYAQNQQVLSVDNTYLLKQDIAHFPFSMKVDQVTEDDAWYYIDYSFHTLQAQDFVWQDASVHRTMKLSKKEMEGKDVGLSVAEKLGEVVEGERHELADAQKTQEANGQTQKTVATEYSGLIGQLLNSDTKVFPAYTPVVTEASTTERGGSITVLPDEHPFAPHVSETLPPVEQIAQSIEQNLPAAATVAATPAPSTPLVSPSGGMSQPSPASPAGGSQNATTSQASTATTTSDVAATSTPLAPPDGGTGTSTPVVMTATTTTSQASMTEVATSTPVIATSTPDLVTSIATTTPAVAATSTPLAPPSGGMATSTATTTP